jgi:hypothetical protein
MTQHERQGPDPERVRETLRQEDEVIERERGDDVAPEDLESDPAYDPDDPALKRTV